MKRKIILPALFLTGALAAGTLGVSLTSAQDSTNYPPIIQKLAERFGLEPDEVQDVFEEERAGHHAEMLANFEDRLSEAVSEGKITEEQKQKILDKQEEMEAKMEEWKDLSPEELKTKMQEYHNELKAWAEGQGIEFPFFAFKMGFGPRFRGGMMFEQKLD